MTAFDAIYLSPHLDDAVLSCGGQIHARTGRGERVLVVTCFTADIDTAKTLSDFARAQLDVWRLSPETAMAARREEDRNAVAAVGAEVRHLGFTDAMFRRRDGIPRYGDWAAILDGDPEDGRGDESGDGPTLLESLGRAFLDLPSTAFLAVPLGAGHVDHRLVRSAAEAAFPARSIACFEDLPYALGRRRRWRATGLFRRLRSAVIEIPDDARSAKREALRHYASQDPESSLIPAMERGLHDRGGEGLWWRRG